jgi:sugar phosphate isomerase/epimerase
MPTQNRISLAYLTVQGADPIEHIQAAAEARFDAVGLRLVAPHGTSLEHDIVGNRQMTCDIRAACRETGIEVFDGELLTLSAQAEVAQWLPALDTAAELGMRFMQITSEDPDHQRAVDRFGRVCDYAGQLGIHVAVEFMRYRTLNSLEAALRFVEEAGRDNGGILIDALHLSRSGGTPTAVAASPAHRLLYLQLCDASSCMPEGDDLIREARGGRLYPGEGSLWLDELLDALPGNVDISVEVPNASDPGRTVHERARLAAAATREFLARYRSRKAT